jgi:hypothetical protein
MRRFEHHVQTVLALPYMLLPFFLALLPATDHSLASDLVYMPDETDEISALHLSRLGGWTEVLFRAGRDEADQYEIRETLFSPRLHLAVEGSAYHKKFLTFNLDGTVSLERYRVRGDVSRSNNLTFADYNGSATIFGQRAASLSLFARRDNAWVDDHFQSSYRVQSSAVGAEFHTKGPYLPFTIAYDHVERDEDFVRTNRVEERDNLRFSTTHRVPFSQTDVSLRYLDLSRNIQPQDYETVSAALNNVLRLFPESRIRLHSYGRYFNQYGSIRRRDVGISEEATVRWTKDLRNSLGYRFSEQTGSSSGGSAGKPELTRSHRGEVGVRHTLYGSLTSALHAYASRLDVLHRSGDDDRRVGENKRRGLRAHFSYRRRTMLGRLRLGFGFEVAREDQTSEDRRRNVSNEEHVMRDGDEPLLDNARVDVGSIVVTDETGFIVYQEGIDYRAETWGSRTRLVRVLSGNIADGETVLVDYAFSFSPDLSFDTRGTSVTFRLDTPRGVSLYYRYNRERDDFVSGVANGFLEDQTSHVAGVTWSWNTLSVGDEYEVNRLSVSEFLTNRLFTDFSVRLPHNTTLNLGGTYTRTRFTEADRTLNIYMVNARFTAALRKGLSLESEAWLRVDRGSPDEDGLDSELGGTRVKVIRQWRALTLEVGLFFRDANDNEVRDQRRSVFISAKRQF